MCPFQMSFSGGVSTSLHQPKVTLDGRDLPGYSAEIWELSGSKSLTADPVLTVGASKYLLFSLFDYFCYIL